MNTSYLAQRTLATDGQVEVLTPHGKKTHTTLEIERLDALDGDLAYEVQYFDGGPWHALPGSPNQTADGNEVYEWAAYNAWEYRFTLTQGLPPTIGVKVTLKLWNEGDVDPGLTETTSAYAADRIST